MAKQDEKQKAAGKAEAKGKRGKSKSDAKGKKGQGKADAKGKKGQEKRKAPPAPPPRMRDHYLQEVVPQLMKRFSYANRHQVPVLKKVVLNMGAGDALTNIKFLEAASADLATIAGQQPSVRRAKKAIASFKLREGNPIGTSVTLRGTRMYEFVDRLISVAIPRIRDFRGLPTRGFDGRGNYTFGIKEQIIFPEIKYDKVEKIRGMDVTLVTSAATDEEGFELLKAMRMPFRAR